MCVVVTLFESWVLTFWRRRLPPPLGPQSHSHAGHNRKAKDAAFSHLVCYNFYSFLYASRLLVEKVTLAAFAVLRSVWYRTVETMKGSHTKCSFILVNRKVVFGLLWLSFFMSKGAGEVWAQAPTLGMAVWAEGALFATESHWPVWEGSSYVLLLLWSGKHQCFVYVLYCNFQTQSEGMWHKSAVVQGLIWMLPSCRMIKRKHS